MNKVILNDVLFSQSVSNAAIKNTASSAPQKGWFPSFSASGQDVWLPNYRFEGKGIVISAVGARCGKAFRADGKWNVVANTHVLLLDESRCDRDYMWYLLNDESWWIKSGSGQPFVKIKDSLKRSILLPSLNEQKQITAKLDKVVDLIVKRRQQLEKLDELVKSRFVEMFGKISDKQQVMLEEVCSIITDGTHQPPKFVAAGIPFLFVSNIVSNTITYKAEKYITEDTYNELIKRTPIAIGDILLSTVGSYGHPAVVKTNKPFCFQRHIAYLKPKVDVINSAYLHGAILSHDVQQQIEKRVKGVAQKTLNLSEIRKLRFSLPSMETQEQFAAFVERIDKSKWAIHQSLDKLETLKKALMQKYFGWR